LIREDSTLVGKNTVQFTLQRQSSELWWRLWDIWAMHYKVYIFKFWAYPLHFDDRLHYFNKILATVRFLV